MEFANVSILRKVPCLLRDGITLYADIYRPPGGGDCPVLLLRQPYGRAIASTVSHAHPVWYASRGYMVVVQDVRGRGDSEGEFTPFVHEAEDGYDAVEWAASLPGSNGKVGMYGFSYQGAAQWAAASLHPPHLVTIVPSMTAADLYHGWLYPYGSFDAQNSLPWAYQLARDGARRAGDAEAEKLCTQVMQDPASSVRRLPLNDGHPLLETYMPAYFDWAGHPEYDEYWARLNWLEAFRSKPIPALHIGGWYDFLLQGTIQSFAELQRDGGRSPELFHRLEIGPWTHIPWGRKAGGLDHGPEADGGMHLKQARWFDYWLKGERDNGVYEEAPVRYFEPFGKRWEEADAWPDAASVPAGASGRIFLSGSELPANGALGGGRLKDREEEIDGEAAPDVFVYDARLPMPLATVLPADRSQLQDRYEILVYTGEPLRKELHVFGSPMVHAVCQTLDGPTDLVAVLTLLHPGGEATFLSVGRTEIGGAGTVRENGWETAVIALRPLAVRCPAGSSIRLELTGSAFPLLLRHPNGMPVGAAAGAGPGELNIATVAVACGNGVKSRIELPLAARSE
ncbi:CocE/NonD family hydrolase [Paenibacillus rhizovicinus]|uniref:CocE/NonD family hydrolase n=1 Tax=Paenibacillus rhizovicinus TaxID=2704463 RepID=A0A6C0NYD3_9BACL|nr:CocE/NonD family hydrolase [Paenibacillus rhizovicinus]QHW29482.1 CocE/NonD family hydrolase [Paenibacillus rhizovicinus]